MKTIKIFIIFSLVMVSLNLSAQLKILSNGWPYMRGHVYFHAYEGDGSSGTAYIQARDMSGTSNIGFQFRTQNNGSIVNAMSISSYGDIQYYVSLTYGSDYRLKQNITYMKSDASQTDSIYRLNAITFDRKTCDTCPPISTDKRKHLGYVAQELRKVYPNLVYEDEKGYLSVDYISLIPVITEALKAQNQKIKDLESRLSSIENKKGGLKSAEVKNLKSDANSVANGSPSLDQNAPNPFNQSTNINYFLPAPVQNASINVYDMNGVQIKSIPVNTRGKGTVVINANELRPGLYFYNLIADGQEVSMKRMVVTQ